MRFEIVFAPQAVRDFRALKARTRSEVRDAIEAHLRHEPGRASRSRIKRLRGRLRPQFRLRVRDVRVFYDVAESVVQILAIFPKARVEVWLREAEE